jgi:hypothetical protein
MLASYLFDPVESGKFMEIEDNKSGKFVPFRAQTVSSCFRSRAYQSLTGRIRKKECCVLSFDAIFHTAGDAENRTE